MKLYVRFTLFIIMGLMAFLLAMGLVMVGMFEGVLPRLGYPNAGDSTGLFLVVFCASFVIGGTAFSVFFVRPLLTVLTMIDSLTKGDQVNVEKLDRLYTSKGRLKIRYRLYKEVITNLLTLSDHLMAAEQTRQRLGKAKENWLSGVSHDLKTPLSYITGYSSMLLSPEHSWTLEEQHKFLSEINAKGKLIEEMIGDLNLTFRLENADDMPIQATEVEVCGLLQTLIADVASSPRAAGYHLELVAPETGIVIEADRKLLNRAIQNLLMNAIEHNPAGTKIVATITENGGGVEIAIEDNGKGISPDLIGRLFTRYVREKSQIGTHAASRGLGLSVVKSIVDAHHGTVDVTSKPSEGTRFIIRLRHHTRE